MSVLGGYRALTGPKGPKGPRKGPKRGPFWALVLACFPASRPWMSVLGGSGPPWGPPAPEGGPKRGPFWAPFGPLSRVWAFDVCARRVSGPCGAFGPKRGPEGPQTPSIRC